MVPSLLYDEKFKWLRVWQAEQTFPNALYTAFPEESGIFQHIIRKKHACKGCIPIHILLICIKCMHVFWSCYIRDSSDIMKERKYILYLLKSLWEALASCKPLWYTLHFLLNLVWIIWKLGCSPKNKWIKSLHVVYRNILFSWPVEGAVDLGPEQLPS